MSAQSKRTRRVPSSPRSARRPVAGLVAGLLFAGVLPATMASPALAADGQGFNLNASDLAFILKQIKISERHAATPPDPNDPCAGLLGPDADQIPNQNAQGAELPWGLRTVDGTCNNLKVGQSDFGAAGRMFPRKADANFRDAEAAPPGFPAGNTGAASSYNTKTGFVYDTQPRVASNLIVDQTDTNPAAVAAAGVPTGAATTPGETLFIENVAPDEGLSAPYNSTFTLFGQFFDHGLDLVGKSGSSVFVPLKDDDPLVLDPDHNPATTDTLPAHLRFMVLTRAITPNGPDGVAGTADDTEATNKTAPYVDQSQTYTSHPSHQAFLREYTDDVAVEPVVTGRMLTGPGDGLATWADVKTQAAAELGIELVDADIFDVPLLATDQYGTLELTPTGQPQLVTATGLVPLTPGTAVPVPADAVRTGHSFLDDIAHNAVPKPAQPAQGPTRPAVPALTPDTNTTITGATGVQDAGTYDDEMLDAHFVAGDGRINENIGLTAIHHVFHSEHNRLVGNINDLLTEAETANPASTVLEDWKSTAGPAGWDYGERLFQAARFVTEMQYQHLAFEEFARKVQPMVNLFGGYDTSIDAAITAEFAHAVYRFGHSMLTESVDRKTVAGANRDIDLLDAFLNPPAFYDGGIDPEAAVGDIVRGMTAQRGNEIDEFVTEALRNNLLGLPLDLAVLNMARARETGVPSLNEARRSFFRLSNGDSALAPYENWIDFGLGLRNHDSLINFVAAYGTHDSIVNAPTNAAKRDAATVLVSNLPLVRNDVVVLNPPADAEAFMQSTDGTSGLEDVDLWVGGLAEAQSPFGGLLGSTFNFVFETQMEDLQDGDRLYYLTRTAGLNLLVQLEGNSFAELISRNSNASNLPADVFSSPDLVFDLSKQNATGSIVDDLDTTYNETTLLSRMADGTIRYAGELHVLFVGTENADKMRANAGDDTLRGNELNDKLEGGAGNDQLIGGSGEDMLTDTFGDDVLKGGDGNDALSSGAGFDLNQSGRGDDFVVGGSDPTETFGGPGDDKIFAGASTDTVFGDDGDDWLEGGGQNDLVQGDNGAPFQDDPNTPGHDVLNGNGGADDYDAEGGDDIMVAGPGIERNEGMFGFDWVTHKNDPQAADDDLNLSALLPPSLDALRDRFDLVEGVSGGNLNDILRGDDAVDTDLADGHVLTQEGINRIEGLAGLLPAGTTSFNGGNIIIGGQGNDLMEGRAGNDILDGDVWLNVRLRAPDLATTDPADTKLVDSMTTLQADVLAGRMNPGDIKIHRNIEVSAAGSFVDTAVYSGPLADYDVTRTANGLVVNHARGLATDGIDTLRNVEQLRFSDQTLTVAAPAPTAVTATAGVNSATVSWTLPATPSVTSFVVRARTGGATPTVVQTVSVTPGTARSTVINNLTGVPHTFTVASVNQFGEGPESAPSAAVTPVANVAPTVTARTPLANATGVAVAANITATFSEPVTGVNGTTFAVRPTSAAPNSTPIGAVVSYNATTRVATLNPSANLAGGTSYTVTLTGGPTAIRDTAGAPLVTTTWSFTTAASAPGAPVIGTAVAGVAGGAITATANWSAPASDGGSAITGYRVRAEFVLFGIFPTGSFTTSAVQPATARTLAMTLTPTGSYRFTVEAINSVGATRSGNSNTVVAR